MFLFESIFQFNNNLTTNWNEMTMQQKKNT